MKIEYIKRGAATRLILIFAGWSTDSRFYENCVINGWDTAIVSDYTEMTLPEIPRQYTTIYIFAYSLGVWTATFSNIKATANVAICGTPMPISNDFGIPESIFKATADGLSDKTLAKFHLRMAGSRQKNEQMKAILPESPDIPHLKEELYSIIHYAENKKGNSFQWNRAYIADADNVIPTSNQMRYWGKCKATETICIPSAHFADIASIIRQCIPDPDSIAEGFAHAVATYRKYATVQSQICLRIGEILKSRFSSANNHVDSLLEIGPGKGLLTDEWSKYIKPAMATYVDLYQMSLFKKATEERYIIRDAEQWIESSDDKFDVILSASAIQWFANPIRFLKILRNHLNSGGIAIISTFTKGNLRELDALRPSPIIYRSVEEYESIEGSEVEHWETILQFKSSRNMLIHLKRTGVKPSTPHRRSNNVSPLQLSSYPTHLTYTPLILTITNNP